MQSKSDSNWVVRVAPHVAEGYLLRARAHLYMFDHRTAEKFYRWCVRVDVGS